MPHDAPIDSSWRAALLTCDVCNTTWACVAQSLAIEAECPECGNMVVIPDAWCDIDDAERNGGFIEVED
jgi:predicted RNA-binding Zn-ribbon protein involved in translation (DUF1610 family)